MKKYIQLCLVLMACVCFVLMAFYERRYSHLQTVIRFMQWSPSPSTPTSHTIPCKDKGNAGDLQWYEAAPGLYSYSAFLLRNQSTVQILSLRHSKSDNSRVMCSFLHDDGTDFSNTYARTIPIKQLEDWNLNILSCPSDKERTHAQLNGVAVSATNDSPERVFSLVVPESKGTADQNFVIGCVRPLPLGYSDIARLSEFVMIAKLAGFQRLIFYHRGLGLKVREFLNQEKQNGFINLFPFGMPLGSPTEIVDAAALLDCFLRSSLEASSTIVQMDMNTFFIPAQNTNISSALPNAFSGLVTFKTHIFCMELPDDIVSRTLHIPFLTLRKTKRLKDSTISSLLVVEARDDAKHLKIIKNSLDPQKIASLSSTVAVSNNRLILNHYGKCRSKKIATGVTVDTGMMAYKEELFKLLKLYTRSIEHA